MIHCPGFGNKRTKENMGLSLELTISTPVLTVSGTLHLFSRHFNKPGPKGRSDQELSQAQIDLPRLPGHVLSRIGKLLNQRDLLSARVVCKEWLANITTDVNHWELQLPLRNGRKILRLIKCEPRRGLNFSLADCSSLSRHLPNLTRLILVLSSRINQASFEEMLASATLWPQLTQLKLTCPNMMDSSYSGRPVAINRLAPLLALTGLQHLSFDHTHFDVPPSCLASLSTLPRLWKLSLRCFPKQFCPATASPTVHSLEQYFTALGSLTGLHDLLLGLRPSSCRVHLTHLTGLAALTQLRVNDVELPRSLLTTLVSYMPALSSLDVDTRNLHVTDLSHPVLRRLSTVSAWPRWRQASQYLAAAAAAATPPLSTLRCSLAACHLAGLAACCPVARHMHVRIVFAEPHLCTNLSDVVPVTVLQQLAPTVTLPGPIRFPAGLSGLCVVALWAGSAQRGVASADLQRCVSALADGCPALTSFKVHCRQHADVPPALRNLHALRDLELYFPDGMGPSGDVAGATSASGWLTAGPPGLECLRSCSSPPIVELAHLPTALTYLRLSGVCLGGPGGGDGSSEGAWANALAGDPGSSGSACGDGGSSDGGACRFAGRAALSPPELLKLKLIRCGLAPGALPHFAASLPSLMSLRVIDCALGREDRRALSHLTGLTKLSVVVEPATKKGRPPPSAAGLLGPEWLSAVAGLTSLRVLTLRMLSELQRHHLAPLSRLRCLHSVRLKCAGGCVRDDAVKACRLLPFCEVSWL